MDRKISYLIIAINLHVLVAFSQLQTKSFHTYYKIDIYFNPDSGYINCKTEIQNPSDSSFLLTKTMKIHSIKSDGKSVSFHQKLSESSPNSFEISIPVIPLKIVIDYSGQIKTEDFPNHISSINMVNKELIELSDYIDWYPRMLNYPSFEYVLDVDLPSKYVTVLNGLLAKKEIINNRSITRWKSHSMTSGITLLAAPNLKKASSTLDGITIEIYYDKIPKTYVDSMKIDLLRSVQLLTDLFGSTISENLINVSSI